MHPGNKLLCILLKTVPINVSMFQSPVCGSSLYQGHKSCPHRNILPITCVFIHKMVECFCLAFTIVCNVTNNKSRSHANLVMYFVSLRMFRLSYHLNFNHSGDGFYPACVNKLQCSSQLSTESGSTVDTECEGDAVSINTLKIPDQHVHHCSTHLQGMSHTVTCNYLRRSAPH